MGSLNLLQAQEIYINNEKKNLPTTESLESPKYQFYHPKAHAGLVLVLLYFLFYSISL